MQLKCVYTLIATDWIVWRLITPHVISKPLTNMCISSCSVGFEKRTTTTHAVIAAVPFIIQTHGFLRLLIISFYKLKIFSIESKIQFKLKIFSSLQYRIASADHDNLSDSRPSSICAMNNRRLTTEHIEYGMETAIITVHSGGGINKANKQFQFRMIWIFLQRDFCPHENYEEK